VIPPFSLIEESKNDSISLRLAIDNLLHQENFFKQKKMGFRRTQQNHNYHYIAKSFFSDS